MTGVSTENNLNNNNTGKELLFKNKSDFILLCQYGLIKYN